MKEHVSKRLELEWSRIQREEEPRVAKINVVLKCADCIFCHLMGHSGKGWDFRCGKHVDAGKFRQIDVNAELTIPRWCPLENYYKSVVD